MEALSKKEVEIISKLEFDQTYFFTRKQITPFFQNSQHLSDFIFGLKKKKRIIKINRSKYYLIPIKAKSGGWSEDPFIIADEICNSKNYFIGGFAAANYWKFTDQIPQQIDLYATQRQGKTKIQTQNSILRHISGHPFSIIKKERAKKWIHQKP